MRTFDSQRSFVSRTWLTSALIGLVFQLGTIDAFGSVIYQYVEAGSGVVLGSIEVDSPPASATAGWSTVNDADLVALFLNDTVFGFGTGNLVIGNTVSFIAMSLTGATLDGGGIAVSFPTIVGDPTIDRALSLSFELPLGADFGAAATTLTYSSGLVTIADQFVEGDWVVQQVPEPGGLALFGLALLVGRWRRRSR